MLTDTPVLVHLNQSEGSSRLRLDLGLIGIRNQSRERSKRAPQEGESRLSPLTF